MAKQVNRLKFHLLLEVRFLPWHCNWLQMYIVSLLSWSSQNYPSQYQ